MYRACACAQGHEAQMCKCFGSENQEMFRRASECNLGALIRMCTVRLEPSWPESFQGPPPRCHIWGEAVRVKEVELRMYPKAPVTQRRFLLHVAIPEFWRYCLLHRSPTSSLKQVRNALNRFSSLLVLGR